MSQSVPGPGPVDSPSPESWLAVAVLLLAVAAAFLNWRWPGWWERPVARLARRKWTTVLVTAAAPVLLRAILLPWLPAPAPRVHDEFSFLLAGDTLAHGRLANPAHPLWPHFESVHILARPTYASAFPIAQAFALALGQVVFDSPWAGVVLSAGLMCGAICWMLQGWLPPRWALLGAVLVILRIGVSSYWVNTYWGGCMAAIGGALVLGALPRIQRSPRWRSTIPMGVGLAILANSRPIEGGFFAFLIAIALFAWMLGKRGPSMAVALRQIMLPLGAMVVLTLAGDALYFARVTGKPWVAPYVLYRDSMSVAPHFLWQKPTAEPLYNNRTLREFYVYREMAEYDAARKTPWQDLALKFRSYWRLYFGLLLSIPLVALPWVWRDRKSRPLLYIGAAFPLVLVGQVWHNPHYAAPAMGLAMLLVVLCMRRMRPRALVWFIPVGCAAMLLFQIAAGRAGGTPGGQNGWRWPAAGGVARARTIAQLEEMGGKHVVLVRYSAHHDPGDEWVYNGADIDGSKVIWARELDRGSNAELARYFAGRRLWLVEPDEAAPRLRPYDAAAAPPMAFVQVGAPGIAAIRSADEVRRRMLAVTALTGPRTCDVWNYEFMDATGVAGPPALPGCYGVVREEPVAFERWFAWLLGQR